MPARHARRRPRACACAASTSRSVLPPEAPAAPAPGQPSIRVLERAVLQRIAAGEVLAGPACVVRELVENALDAGCGAVDVDVAPEERTVTVTDDGRGMGAVDIVAAAACNATSKLSGVEALEALGTLGFRGQGLWAVASVSKGGLVALSRVCGQDAGVRVLFDGDGTAVEAVRCGMRVGTVVSARRVGWAFGAVEVRKARQWVERASLVWPAVAFTLSVEGRVVWRGGRGAGGGVDGALAPFARSVGRPAGDFRRGCVDDAVALGGGVDVVVGVPSRVHFSDTARIVVAVNGRCVDMPDVEKRVRAVFRSALPARRYPACFVRIRATAPGACDWNVSPMKATMRLRARDDVPALVERAIHLALAADFTAGRGDDAASAPAAGAAVGEAALTAAPSAAVVELLVRGREARVAAAAAAATSAGGSEEGEGRAGAGRGAMMKIVAVAQALGTYILAEHDSSGLFLIEQHVAHERILFEGLRDGWATSFVPLPADRAVALPAAIARDDERLLALSALGFDVAVGEDGDYATATVRSVPSLLAGAPREELLAAVAALSAGDGAGGSVDEAAASLACRTAVKNGAVLSRKQMDRIVADLARCRNPHTCPHGRPVFFEIGHRDLAAIFQRRWIPKLAAAGGKRARRRVRGVL